MRPLSAIALLALITTPAFAESPIWGFEGNLALVATTGVVNRTLGWTFTTNAAIEITALGYFDGGNTSPAQPADGFFVEHDIGILDADRNLIVQITIPAGQSGFVIDNWRYNGLSQPIVLDANQTYTIASYAPEGTYGTANPYDPLPSVESEWIFPGPPIDVHLPAIDINPAVTFVGSHFRLFIDHLTFPNNTASGNNGLEGANFLFNTICLADLNNDGLLNFFDVSAFLVAFANNDLAVDLNNDGELNFFDVSAFLNAFAKGCP